MNERIKQLAEQADEYAKQTVHYYMGQFDGLTWEGKIKQTRDKKFAELIVGECVRVVEGGHFLHDQAPTALFAKECSGAIKKHFGVEE